MPKFPNDPAMFQLKSGNTPLFKTVGAEKEDDKTPDPTPPTKPPVLDETAPLLQDVDTGFADKVYTKARVDDELTKSGHHTEGGLRGKKKSKHHDTGKGSFLGTGDMA